MPRDGVPAECNFAILALCFEDKEDGGDAAEDVELSGTTKIHLRPRDSMLVRCLIPSNGFCSPGYATSSAPEAG